MHLANLMRLSPAGWLPQGPGLSSPSQLVQRALEAQRHAILGCCVLKWYHLVFICITYTCVYIHINICICVCVWLFLDAWQNMWQITKDSFQRVPLIFASFFSMRFRPKKPIPKYILDTAGTFAHRTTVLLWWRRSPVPAGSRSQRSCGSPSCGSAVVGVERRWSSCGTRLKGPYGARNWTVHIGHENLNHLIPEAILGAPRGWTVDVVAWMY